MNAATAVAPYDPRHDFTGMGHSPMPHDILGNPDVMEANHAREVQGR
jgi:hypothetical protein